MAEARPLSQWEIDALLNEIPDSGAEQEPAEGAAPSPTPREASLARAIKTYDFRRPDKFSKEQWQTLQAMHEAFARLVGDSFSSRLRSLVTTRLSSIEQGLYEEWQTQVPSPTACYVIALPPLSGNIVVEFNQDVAVEVIDRLLGGTGTLLDRGRDMTEIELSLLRSFSSAITSALQDMWEKVSPVKPELQDLGMDASVIQVAGPNDVVVTAFFEVNLGSHLGAMSVCVPYSVIEPVAGSLSTQIWQSSARQVVQDGHTRRTIEALLHQVPVEISVELGAIELPVRDVLALEEGNTLILDALAERPLAITIDGIERFRCRPGTRGNRLAVSLTEVLPLPAEIPFEEDDEADAIAVPPEEPPALAAPALPPALEGEQAPAAIAPPPPAAIPVATEVQEAQSA